VEEVEAAVVVVVEEAEVEAVGGVMEEEVEAAVVVVVEEEVEAVVVVVAEEAVGGVMEEEVEAAVVEEGVVLEEEGEVTLARTVEAPVVMVQGELGGVAEATTVEGTPTRPGSTALRAVVMVAPGGLVTTGRLAEPEGMVVATLIATGLLDTVQTGEQALGPTHATRKDILRKC